jgi:hypothetical protein
MTSLALNGGSTPDVSTSFTDKWVETSSGVSLPTVSKIESGSYGEPGFRTMVRLARGYGVPVANFEQFFK